MHVHLVGIGGAAMSALANIHLARGDTVSGSDRAESATTRALAAAGATIHIGHAAENIGAADLVVSSTALATDNPELAAARARGIALVHRSRHAATLCEGRDVVAVAGTHGKTTTTTMVAAALASLDPLVLSGGRLPGSEFNSRAGAGRIAVVEADESDRSFLALSPRVAVVTNIEADHLDRYRDLAEIRSAFQDFASRVHGVLIGCVDDVGARALLAAAPGEVLGYGFRPAEIQGADYRPLGGGSTFWVGTPWGNAEVHLGVPGRHNARNALAALAAGLALGVPLPAVLSALAAVALPGRRMEYAGEINGARVYDDYAHHPTEVATTLHAARELGDGRLVCAFQPHRYSRLAALMTEFAGCFPEADEVLLLPVYAAGEDPVAGVDTGALAAAIKRLDPAREVTVLDSLADLPGALRRVLRPGDVAVCMGAGDIYRVAA